MRSLAIGLLVFGYSLIGYHAQDPLWGQDTNLKVFQNGYIEVTEISESGQSRYQAVRAAKLMAQREILELVQGLRLYGNTSVKDGMLASDRIQTQVEGFIRGAVECGTDYNTTQGYANVCLRLHVPSMYGIMNLFKEEGVQPDPKPLFEPSPAFVQKAVFSTVESESTKVPDTAAQQFDGVIVDVRDYGFKPALENRLLTEDESVLFDHSKVASHILIDRGSNGYAVDVRKAKALLGSWGSQAPLTLKSVGVVGVTDAEISTQDAAKIYYYDEKANILAQGRIVFLLR